MDGLGKKRGPGRPPKNTMAPQEKTCVPKTFEDRQKIRRKRLLKAAQERYQNFYQGK